MEMELGINLNVGSKVAEEFRELIATIPAELKKIQGLNELDPFVISERFFQSANVADASIDANANMSGKSPVSFQSEIFKPQLKYRSYYEMWKRLRDKYDLETANDCIRSCVVGALYFHDITKIDEPYCFAFDTSFMIMEGRPYGWLTSVAPKRSSSFMSQLVECTMDMSQEHAGAIGIANLIVNLAYFTRKERKSLHDTIEYNINTFPQVSNSEFSTQLLVRNNIADAIEVYLAGMDFDTSLVSDELSKFMNSEETSWDKIAVEAYKVVDIVFDKYVQNLFQNFVHIMHNTFRVGGDSPFTNMSLFDKLTFKTVFADAKYPDFSAVIDNYEEVNHLQHIFVEFFYKGSPANDKNYRFPVVTANIKTNADGKIEDEEFFNYIVLKNKLRGAFNIHVGEKVATCCFGKDQVALTRNSITGVEMDTFENLWEKRKSGNNFKIFHNGSWVKGKLVRIPSSGHKLYKVTTANNKELLVTDNHINVTLEGDKRTDKLTTQDYLMFNTQVLGSIPEHDKGLTYEDGFLIGLYLGDGSSAYDETNSPSLSLNKKKWDYSERYIQTAIASQLGESKHASLGTVTNNAYPVSLPLGIREFIQTWVKGTTAGSKELNMNCLLQSVEFRKGIVDGYVVADGDWATKTLIYSVSYRLLQQIEAVLTSLGTVSRVYKNDEKGHEVVIRGKEYDSNFDVWCLSIYKAADNTRNYENLFKKHNNSIFYKISSIEEVEYNDEFVYCFEMKDTEEPYFTLPNGVITHNCRLTSDLSKLKDEIRMDTFGNGGLSIGSHRVVALNLHRMALISKYGDKTIEQVIDEYLAKAEKLLIVHKELLKERVDQKFLKFFNIGWEDLNMFFSTFGYTGLIDAYSVYSGKPIDDIVSDDVELNDYVYFANDVIDRMEQFASDAGKRTPHTAYNVEEIPAENASPKMAQADNFLYMGYQGLDEDDPSQDYIPVDLLSNQMIPLYCNVPMMRRLEISGKLMNKVSGGSILHLNLTEQVTDEAYLELVRMMIEKYRIPHFALNVGSTTCKSGHTTPGIYLDSCPECGGEIDYHTIRVVGFSTDTKDWAKARRDEFFKRQFYGAKDVTAKNILK